MASCRNKELSSLGCGLYKAGSFNHILFMQIVLRVFEPHLYCLNQLRDSGLAYLFYFSLFFAFTNTHCAYVECRH